MAKSDLSQAFDDLNAALTNASEAQLKAAGEFAITIISLRTKKGLDADGNPFRPYVPKYAAWRKRRKLQADKVDLTVQGHMLGSMVPSVTGDNEVTIEFSGTKEIAKAIGNSRLRDFFDVRQDREIEAIAETLAEELIAGILK